MMYIHQVERKTQSLSSAKVDNSLNEFMQDVTWRKITVHFCNNLLQGIGSDSCNITLSLYLKYGTIVILNNCLFEKHSQAFWILLNWGGKRQKGISCMLEAGRKCIKDMRGKIRETKERVLNSIIFLYWYCYPVESYYMWRWPKRKIQGCRI